VASPAAGLCERCKHQRIVKNTRGSRFSLCERSKTDPEFPRYPRLPVLECGGFEPIPDSRGSEPPEGSGEESAR
jgi:hypothetical protein